MMAVNEEQLRQQIVSELFRTKYYDDGFLVECDVLFYFF